MDFSFGRTLNCPLHTAGKAEVQCTHAHKQEHPVKEYSKPAVHLQQTVDLGVANLIAEIGETPNVC
jgi:hypothetical protein